MGHSSFLIEGSLGLGGGVPVSQRPIGDKSFKQGEGIVADIAVFGGRPDGVPHAEIQIGGDHAVQVVPAQILKLLDDLRPFPVFPVPDPAVLQQIVVRNVQLGEKPEAVLCLLYTSDAADD